MNAEVTITEKYSPHRFSSHRPTPSVSSRAARASRARKIQVRVVVRAPSAVRSVCTTPDWSRFHPSLWASGLTSGRSWSNARRTAS
nr:hypothetical protein [Microbispora sp. GKU 823]